MVAQAMDRFRKVMDIIGPTFWALAGGIVALYLFGLVMGVFSPDELLGWTIVAAVLAGLVGWHSHKVRVAIKERDPELMRTLNQAREKRGF
jgi:hypothetical protein